MKYLIVVDDSFISNFRRDDEDKLTLVMADMNGGSRAVRMKPIIRPVVTFEIGESYYLSEGYIQAMLKYEEMAAIKRYIDENNGGRTE